MKEKGMSKGEFNSVAQVNGGLDSMINWDGKDKDLLALIKYIADEDKLEKVLENPTVIKTPVVRNGKQSTIGHQPDVWKGWLQNMEIFYYIVDSIDGDYANLRRTDVESNELKLVARALLPENINEGTKLKYEMLQYEVIQSMFGKKKKGLKPSVGYDSSKHVPIIKASICNGEQVVGFKDVNTGHFTEVMLVREHSDLMDFKRMYNLPNDIVISKEY